MRTGKNKFLFITPGCFDKGGISRYNGYQIKSLIELYGQENVRVLSLFGPDEDSLHNEFKVTWHGKTNDAISKSGLLLNILQQVLFWRPGFIVVGHVNFSGFAWILSLLCKAKTVLDIYGLEIWGHLSKDASLGFKKVDHVIADCHYTANYVEKTGIRPEKSIEVIWDCVDLEQFKPRPDQWEFIERKYGLPDRQNHFIILTLGRLSKDAAYKGYERLLKVFISLVKKHPHAKLVFAGKGDLIPELKAQAREAGIIENVYFTGSVPEDEMAAIYSYAHVFSLVSHRDNQSGEGIPLTPLEAMACRVPVIVGNHDGSQEAVIDERNGIVIDPFDLHRQENFLVELINNPPLREKMADQALEIAGTHFSYRGFKDKHKEFFSKKIFGA